MFRCILHGLFALSIFTFSCVSFAENVQLKFNKITLNADLEKVADWPQHVVLMTHGTLAHNKMEIMSTLQRLLAARGVSSLSINLSLGINDRASAMYDCAAPHNHKHADAVDEIGAWVQWLKQQGVKNITLLGHSRGGNQTAWYAAERDDASIKHVVLIAPATWNATAVAQGYQKNNTKSLAQVLGEAQKLVAANQSDAPMKHTDFLYCKDTTVTAGTFVGYYAPDARFDTPTLLPKIKKPVLVFAGTEDDTVPDVAQKVGPLADGKNITLKVIDGADHFFLDLYAEDVADAVVKFIH